MSIVNIRNIELVNNPAKFDDEYHFRIKFEAIAPLAEDLEWRLIYVGSATGEEYDQELDSCMVGPIPAGINAFDFQAPAPAHHLLPSQDPEEVLGVTVIIITASYKDKEFVRVGYYVNTYYEEQEMMDNPPAQVLWDRLHRNVLIEKPKVTRFQNPWDSTTSTDSTAPEQQQQQQQQAAPSAFSSGFTNGSGGFSNGSGAGAGVGGSFESGMGMPFNAPLPPPVKAMPAAAQEVEVGGGMELDP